jgi:hypothetical protein
MYTGIDEGKGLVKCYWQDIRDQVAKVEPKFAQLVDEIAPGKEFPVYKAYYPYGMHIGDTQTFFFKDANNILQRANSNDIDSEIKKHLGYGADSLPFGMVLDKQLEYYIARQSEHLTIPWKLCYPGDFFPLARVLSRKSRLYAPNGIKATTSGMRSVFMLPNIGCATQHSNLQRDFNVKSPPPKNMSEHWEIFKEIFDSNVIETDWKSCLIYFSENWVKSIHTEKKWQDVKVYLYENDWHNSEYLRNKVYYDIIFSVIQNSRNLKPNPYLADTAQHLFTTALGDAPGYIPAITDDGLPLEMIQKAYVESYGLKKYLPNVIQPTYYSFEHEKYPTYYSIQNPATYTFSPKSRQQSSTQYDLREIEHIVDIFNQELSNDQGMAYNTVMNTLSKKLSVRYFHNKTDRHNIIQPSSMIPSYDNRFYKISPEYKLENAIFAADGPFVRGCISLSTN